MEQKRKPGNPNLVKGVVLNPTGRPKGQSEQIKKLRNIMSDILEDKLNPANFAQLWNECSPKDKVALLGHMSKYVLPAMASIDIKGTMENKITTVNIQYTREDASSDRENPQQNYDDAEIIPDNQLPDTNS